MYPEAQKDCEYLRSIEQDDLTPSAKQAIKDWSNQLRLGKICALGIDIKKLGRGNGKQAIFHEKAKD